MNRFKIFAMWLLALALYLNFGWYFVGYYEGHVICDYAKDGSTIEKILSSPRNLLYRGNKVDCIEGKGITNDDSSHFFVSSLWPILIIIGVFGWLFYGIYIALWLIFAGGIVKLLGPKLFISWCLVIIVLFIAWFTNPDRHKRKNNKPINDTKYSSIFRT